MEHRIREEAYFIWQKTGSLDELANWLEAERQIVMEEARLKQQEKEKPAPTAKSATKTKPVAKKATPVKTALKKAGLGSKAKKK